MEINKNEVGFRISTIRKQLGDSQESFGKKMNNAHKSLVSKWEKGQSLPNNTRLKLISDLGGISVEELQYGSRENYLKQLLNEFKTEGSNNPEITEVLKKGIFTSLYYQYFDNDGNLRNPHLYETLEFDEINKMFTKSVNKAIKKWTAPGSLEETAINELHTKVSNGLEDFQGYFFDSADNNKNYTYDFGIVTSISKKIYDDVTNITEEYLVQLYKIKNDLNKK